MGGRRFAVYVPDDLVPEVRALLDRGRQIQELLYEASRRYVEALNLKVRVTARTGGLLLAFSVAYTLALAVAASDEAKAARRALEVPRRRPRHGTQRTLSVLTLAAQMLSHPTWRDAATARLRAIARRIQRGLPALTRPPPLALPHPRPP